MRLGLRTFMLPTFGFLLTLCTEKKKVNKLWLRSATLRLSLAVLPTHISLPSFQSYIANYYTFLQSFHTLINYLRNLVKSENFIIEMSEHHSKGGKLLRTRNSLYFFREPKSAIYRLPQNFCDFPPYLE